MAEVNYKIGSLSSDILRGRVRAFCKSQSTSAYNDYMFDLFAQKGGIFCAALIDGEVIGCTASVPVEGNVVLGDLLGVTEWLVSNGYYVEETDYPALTFVSPEHQGKGISNEMHRLKFQHQIDKGYKQSINFAFETKSAYDYYHHLGNLHDTGLPNYMGQKIYLTPLKDALLSVS